MVGQRLQMAFAAVSIGVMVYVLVDYMREDHRAPPARTGHMAPAVPAIADTHPAPRGDHHPAPYEVWQNAKLGDWYAYTYVTSSKLGAFHSTVLVTVTAATDTAITTRLRGKIAETGETRDEAGDEFPRTNLTLEHLIGFDISDWTVLSVIVADADHQVGGREFHGKKVTYTSKDPVLPTKKTTTELWLSPEVPGGLVEEHEVQDLAEQDLHFDMTKTLIGFGTTSTTTWGTKPTF
jgi:hypothetical protein